MKISLNLRILALAFGTFFVLSPAISKDTFVKDFGAKGDGVTLCTKQIQAAIDACAKSGGGRVMIADGRYLSGSIYLRSHTELYVNRGAALLGSTDVTNQKIYPVPSLVYAEGVEDVGISGEGVINGQALHPDFVKQGWKVNQDGRPHCVKFYRCNNVSVKDVQLEDADFWTMRLQECDGVRISGVRIRSLAQGNNDGIDVDARNVVITNCLIECDDDGICLKSDNPNFMVENIAISNCVIASNCNPIKFGTASEAGFRNISITGCTIRRTTESNIWHWWLKYDKVAEGTLTGLSGIAIESADGGLIEHVNIDNITMEGIITPIFINLSKRNSERTGIIRDVNISHISATADGIIPCLLCGIKESHISDITLRDIRVEQEGGELPMQERLGENLTGYPENRMYGRKNPACGLFVRHADNVVVENFMTIQRHEDLRPAIVADDVDGLFVRHLDKRNVKGMNIQTIDSKNVCLDGKWLKR